MLGYTSDMSDEEWGLIEEIINKRKGSKVVRPLRMRKAIMEWDILYNQERLFWRDLPKDFGPWK
ncbi:hypothetical protein REIP_1834 [Rickettsia endosymbiont of Ixodes pacificus]|uniref:transposase n=1 Tax=Rickettsia endosymbiont of Ixodes pacificus TaxID=1133329 RepID=UPI0005F8901A|nr:transposase [Rickettsia endosymbiont of Ixodes pacificus]KJW01694.1 hypothetical protein REIP_1834 [Rickettsia endosymbiont of Ixodes pacificus]